MNGYWKDIMMSEATGWDLSLTGGRDAVLETVCSVCGDCCAFGGDGEDYLSPYCPNCGARMDGDIDACDCCGKETETLYKIPHYELGDDNIMTFNHNEQKLCTECAQRLCDLINGFSKCSCGKKEG